jgi:hypothetical protein
MRGGEEVGESCKMRSPVIHSLYQIKSDMIRIRMRLVGCPHTGDQKCIKNVGWERCHGRPRHMLDDKLGLWFLRNRVWRMWQDLSVLG